VEIMNRAGQRRARERDAVGQWRPAAAERSSVLAIGGRLTDC
jgi:hypothetical protein